jgi:hypothetical protein
VLSVLSRTHTRFALVTTALLAASAALGFFVSIVGGTIVFVSGLVALVTWRQTFLKRSVDPAIVLPPYLAALAGFYTHLIEEYVGHYAPAISRLFGIEWSDTGFVVTSYALAAGLLVVAIGLYYRSTLAGFVAWLFLVSRLAELLLFVFPLMRPAVEPEVPAAIPQIVAHGVSVGSMPNYYCHVTGNYYFAGMYTVVLAIGPALYAMYRIWHQNPPHRYLNG